MDADDSDEKNFALTPLNGNIRDTITTDLTQYPLFLHIGTTHFQFLNGKKPKSIIYF